MTEHHRSTFRLRKRRVVRRRVRRRQTDEETDIAPPLAEIQPLATLDPAQYSHQPSPQRIISMQRRFGNRAVQRMLRPPTTIQRTLRVGEDEYENAAAVLGAFRSSAAWTGVADQALQANAQSWIERDYRFGDWTELAQTAQRQRALLRGEAVIENPDETSDAPLPDGGMQPLMNAFRAEMAQLGAWSGHVSVQSLAALFGVTIAVVERRRGDHTTPAPAVHINPETEQYYLVNEGNPIVPIFQDGGHFQGRSRSGDNIDNPGHGDCLFYALYDSLFHYAPDKLDVLEEHPKLNTRLLATLREVAAMAMPSHMIAYQLVEDARALDEGQPLQYYSAKYKNLLGGYAASVGMDALWEHFASSVEDAPPTASMSHDAAASVNISEGVSSERSESQRPGIVTVAGKDYHNKTDLTVDLMSRADYAAGAYFPLCDYGDEIMAEGHTFENWVELEQMLLGLVEETSSETEASDTETVGGGPAGLPVRQPGIVTVAAEEYRSSAQLARAYADQMEYYSPPRHGVYLDLQEHGDQLLEAGHSFTSWSELERVITDLVRMTAPSPESVPASTDDAEEEEAGPDEMALPDKDEPGAESPQVISSFQELLLDAPASATKRLAQVLRGLTNREHGTEITSTSLSLTFGIGAGIGVANAADISLVPTVTLSGTINVQDDQQLRTGLTLSPSLDLGVKAEGIIEGGLSVGVPFGITQVFPNEESLAAYTIFRARQALHTLFGRAATRIGEAATKLRDPIKTKYLNGLLKRIAALSAYIGEPMPMRGVSPTTVTSTSVQVGASAAGLEGGIAGELGAAFTEMGFTKEAYHEGRRQPFTRARPALQGQISAGATVTLPSNIPVGGGSALALTGTITYIKGHANPDNDGTYFHVKLDIGGIGGSAARALMKTLASDEINDAINQFRSGRLLSKANVKQIVTVLARLIPIVMTESASQLAAGAKVGSNFEMTVSSTASIEVNFVKTGKIRFRRQYVRSSGTTALEVKGGGAIPVGEEGEELVLKGGASAERSRSYGEILGDQTMTYLHTVYNGLMRSSPAEEPQRGADTGMKRWDHWRDRHRRSLRKILKKAGTHGSNTRAEIEATGLASGEALLKQARRYHKKRGGVGYDEVLPFLERYLEDVRQQTNQQAAAGWVPMHREFADVLVYLVGEQSEEGLTLQPLVSLANYTGNWRQAPTTLAEARERGHAITLHIVYDPPGKGHQAFTHKYKASKEATDLQDKLSRDLASLIDPRLKPRKNPWRKSPEVDPATRGRIEVQVLISQILESRFKTAGLGGAAVSKVIR